MVRAAESATARRTEAPARDFAAPGDPRRAPRPRALPPLEPRPDAAQEARARLILRLAADRLRELRDDGVTFGYIARIYDVPPETMTRLYDDLVRPRGMK
ncbi:MAG: hypothetical protein JWM27_3703 [Gemmatimonadetes bacterium]|nr:hypothetical protein [Gemmatimonadota bacterium]